MSALRHAAAPEGGNLRGGAQIKAGGPEPSIPCRPVEEVALDLATMSPRERAVFMAGYETGYLERMEREERSYARAIEDLAAHYVRMIALNEEIERNLASTVAGVPFAELCERRGDHARAERQRRILRERGIWPAAS